MKALKNMSIAELTALRKDVDRHLVENRVAARNKAKASIEAYALRLGYTVSELFLKSRDDVGKPRYANPDNPKETWTGRGRNPTWVLNLLAEGRKLEEFLI